jgi:long-chain acyl-CoA synthetase
LFYYEDLIKEGASLKPINVEAKTKPDDCYTFSYTSGTTGPPKGAMLSHKNVLSFVASLKYESDLLFSNTDTYLSYLPLPHIIERTAVISMVYSGAYLVYFFLIKSLKWEYA